MNVMLVPVAVSSPCSLRDPSRHLIQARQGLKGELRRAGFITRRNLSGTVSTSYRQLRPCSAAPDEEKITPQSGGWEAKKNVTIHVPLEDGGTRVLKFLTYSNKEDNKLMKVFEGVGLTYHNAHENEEVILNYEGIHSGGVYDLVCVRQTIKTRNLERWRKNMSIAQEEEGAERLVDIATKYANGESITRISKKVFNDDNGHILKEIDACVIVGKNAIIGEAKTSVRSTDIATFHDTLEDIRNYAFNNVGDFKIMQGKKITGCMIIKTLPEDMVERNKILSVANKLDIIVEVPNGASWSTGNSLFDGGD